MVWSQLRTLGNSRLIRTSYFWIVFVPLCAKVLAPFHGTHTFRVLGADVTLDIDLPFSWKVFYFMALAFSAASATYTIRCPSIIRLYDSFTAYRKLHLGFGPLTAQLNWTISRLDPQQLQTLHDRLAGAFRQDNPWNKRLLAEAQMEVRREPKMFIHRRTLWQAYHEELRSNADDDRIVSDVFDAIQRSANETRPRSRWLCAMCFILGFAAFLYVLFENCWFVIRFVCEG